MRGIYVVCRLIHNRPLPVGAASISSLNGRTLDLAMSSPSTVPQSSSSTNNNYNKPSFSWFTNPAVSMFQFSPLFNRNFSSNSSGLSNVVVIESEEQFNSSLRKVQDELLPAIFYFTAVWCSPCRLLSPIIGQLSLKYPHVTTYKVDIDHQDLGSALSKLDIHSVPTLHFYQNGKKASEVIGADVQRLKDTMEKLYK